MQHEEQVRLLKVLIQQLDDGVNADAGGLRRAPASTYTSPELLEREWASFFKGHAQIIGMSGELPGPNTFLTLNDFGIPILATRGKDGRFRAFLNSCRHRGVMVEKERHGKRATFSCPFHAWTYSSAGELVAIPMAEHFGAIDKSCHGLIELPAEEAYGFLIVHPDPKGMIDTEKLFEGYADDLVSWKWQDLVFGGETSYDMNLNWKLALDTFGETYHFKRLHKNTLAEFFYGDVLGYDDHGRNHRMILCLKGIDTLRGRSESQWDIRIGGFPVYYFFPNVVVNVGATGVTLVRAYPDPGNPGRSISHLTFMFDKAALEADPENVRLRAEGFGNVVEAEDYATAVTTQTALNAGIQESVIFGRNEPPLHHYHNTYRTALGMDALPLIKG